MASIVISLVWSYVGRSEVWQEYLLRLVNRGGETELVTDITANVIKRSSFSGPFLSIVEREDGSFSYYIIKEALIEGDRLKDIADVEADFGYFEIIIDLEYGLQNPY